MDTICQVGKMFDVLGTLIPAQNIQVDGYPCWKKDASGLTYYPQCFEIMFEDGDHWLVESGVFDIEMLVYKIPGMVEAVFLTWESFLDVYQDKHLRNLRS